MTRARRAGTNALAHAAEALLHRARAGAAITVGRVLVVTLLGAGSNDVIAAAGVLASSALFSVAHLYQGKRGLVSTFVLGGVFGASRILTGSLLPAMVNTASSVLSSL